MQRLMPLFLAFLGACATQVPTESSRTARFPVFPAKLFEAFEKACTTPAQVFASPSPLIVECREYLDLDATASAILQFDGTTADLPQLVIRFTTWPDGTGYLLRTDTYLNVPQKNGGPVRVIFQNSRYERKLVALYRLTGGVAE